MIQLKMTLKPGHTSIPPDTRMADRSSLNVAKRCAGRLSAVAEPVDIAHVNVTPIAWAATRMKIDQPDQAGPCEIDPQIREVLESIPGLVSVAQDGKLECVNHQIYELLGVSFSAIGRVRNRDGEYRWCHWLLKPLFDRAGDAVKYFGHLSDVDASRGLSESLYRASDANMGDQTAADAPPFRSALQRAVSRNAHGPSPCTKPGLSARECMVLALIAKGQSNKRIAQTLGISPETVKSHVKRAFLKLESKTRAEAVTRASALGYLAQSQDPSSAVERRDSRIVERVLAGRARDARLSLP